MFMGTPEISATCLKTMLDRGEDVVAVVTGKDKPRGRGNLLSPTPVKALAEERGIPVLTPDTLRTEAFLEELKLYSPDIIVVVAYGKILPKAVLEFAPHGCINVHVSLLPRHRGAAPMQRAIIEGDRETGITIMQMDEGLDTGDIIAQVSFPINDTDTFETIHDESAEIGGDLLCRVLEDIREGRAVREKQDDSLATYAAKIEKADCKVDFSRTAREVSCQIRGTTPIPGAFCFHNGRMLKVYDVAVVSGEGKVGEVIAIDSKGKGSFTVACGEGAIMISGVIPEGKGRMTAGDLIRGRKLALGDILE